MQTATLMERRKRGKRPIISPGGENGSQNIVHRGSLTVRNNTVDQ